MICDDGGRGKWKIANQKATFFFIWNFQTKILLISPEKIVYIPQFSDKTHVQIFKTGGEKSFFEKYKPPGKIK